MLRARDNMPTDYHGRMDLDHALHPDDQPPLFDTVPFMATPPQDPTDQAQPHEARPVEPPSSYARSHEPTLLTINIDDLHPDPNNARSIIHTSELENLTASVRTHGVLNPILVKRDANKWRIIAGHRRVEAARRAHLSHIQALEITTPDHRISLIDNLHHQHLDPIDYVHAVIAHVADTLAITHDEATRLIRSHRPDRGPGKTPNLTYDALCELERQLNTTFRSFTTNKLALLNLDQSLKDALRQHAISESVALELNKIADPTTRSDLLEQASNGVLTRHELRDHLRSKVDGDADSRRAANALRNAHSAATSVNDALAAMAEEHCSEPWSQSELEQIHAALEAALQRIQKLWHAGMPEGEHQCS